MPFNDDVNQPEQPLAQAILEPLLDDFQYWFSESQQLLTSDRANCLVPEDRAQLLDRLTQAQQEVATARTLLLATAGQAGVETAVVGQWHQLVGRCWRAARSIRQSES